LKNHKGVDVEDLVEILQMFGLHFQNIIATNYGHKGRLKKNNAFFKFGVLGPPF
jgi:hypothetical protein